MLSLWEELVDKTPVDSGTARYSWTFSARVPSTRKPKKKSYPRPDPPDVFGYSDYWINAWYISNNQPYIGKLNEGYSQQAPSGWIDSSIRKIVVRANSGAYTAESMISAHFGRKITYI